MPEVSEASRTSPFLWNEEVRSGLRVAFTSIAAGNLALHVGEDPDAVAANRARLEAAMQLRSGALRFMSQTHSDRVAVVQPPQHIEGRSDAQIRPTRVAVPDADAMISPAGRDPLAVLVADCVPVVLAAMNDTGVTDDQGCTGSIGATAVVHAGRAGVVNGIVGRTVDQLRRSGAEGITAWIGPSVCGACYEVPEDLMLDVARTAPIAASRTRTGSFALDLPAAVRRQLLDADVALGSVGGGNRCTVENPELFSHRRAPGAGRIAGVVWRT